MRHLNVNAILAVHPQYLIIECPDCGEAFLLSKAILRSKKEWEKLLASLL